MANEQDPNFWDEALSDLDVSKLGRSRSEEYPLIPPDEISWAVESNPFKGKIFRDANRRIREIRAHADSGQIREKQYRDSWYLLIEATKGFVGLRVMPDFAYLGYPRTLDEVVSVSPRAWDIRNAPASVAEAVLKENGIDYINGPALPEIDQLVKEILDVEEALEVPRVIRSLVPDMFYEGEDKDPDKPVEDIGDGRFIAYKNRGLTRWAKFWGKPEPTGGRVWVDHSTRHFESVVEFNRVLDEGLERRSFGKGWSNNIAIPEFSFHNKYSPDGPTNNQQAVQKYHERFIRLASQIALMLGEPKFLHLNLRDRTVMIPEDLYREGYDIRWIKGDLGERKGFGQDLVMGKKGDSVVALESASDIVPWITALRVPANRLTTVDAMSGFITEELLYF